MVDAYFFVALVYCIFIVNFSVISENIKLNMPEFKIEPLDLCK